MAASVLFWFVGQLFVTRDLAYLGLLFGTAYSPAFFLLMRRREWALQFQHAVQLPVPAAFVVSHLAVFFVQKAMRWLMQGGTKSVLASVVLVVTAVAAVSMYVELFRPRRTP